MAEIVVNDSNFEAEVIKSEIPVLVDFWAEWCGPCRMLSPVVSAIAAKYEGKLKVCKVNVDEAMEVAEQYFISSILHIGFSRGRSGGLVFPSLSEFSTVYCDAHSQRLWHSQ